MSIRRKQQVRANESARIAKKERRDKGGNDERIEDEGKDGRRKTLQLNSNSCNISLVVVSETLRSSCLASCCLAISWSLSPLFVCVCVCVCVCVTPLSRHRRTSVHTWIWISLYWVIDPRTKDQLVDKNESKGSKASSNTTASLYLSHVHLSVSVSLRTLQAPHDIDDGFTKEPFCAGL